MPVDSGRFVGVLRRLSPNTFVCVCDWRQTAYVELEGMMKTIPPGHSEDNVYIFQIAENARPVGCAFMVRGYPNATTAYLVLLIVVESAQGRSVGRCALRDLESLAKSWGCTSMAAVVDSANDRALKFWLREGFAEVRRTRLDGLVGRAISIEKRML